MASGDIMGKPMLRLIEGHTAGHEHVLNPQKAGSCWQCASPRYIMSTIRERYIQPKIEELDGLNSAFSS